MRKLICAATMGLCTVPVMAAPLGSHLAAARAASGNTAASSNNLPALDLESSLSVPGFGKKGHDPNINPIKLGGLATIDFNADNPAKGNGTATYSETIDLNPNSTKAPTKASADYSIPEGSHQLTAKYAYSGAGFGKGSNPDIKPVTLPGLGTINADYANGGKGDSLSASLTYTSPAPK